MDMGIGEVVRGVESAIGIGYLEILVPECWESGEERGVRISEIEDWK